MKCKHCKHFLHPHVEAESSPAGRATSPNHTKLATCTECAKQHRKRCPGWEPDRPPVDNLAIVGGDMGYDADAHLQKMQEMINTADIWRFEGSMGRAAMDALESGACYLPRNPTSDYFDNRLPARQWLKPGSKGTLLNHERWLEEQAAA